MSHDRWKVTSGPESPSWPCTIVRLSTPLPFVLHERSQRHLLLSVITSISLPQVIIHTLVVIADLLISATGLRHDCFSPTASARCQSHRNPGKHLGFYPTTKHSIITFEQGKKVSPNNHHNASSPEVGGSEAGKLVLNPLTMKQLPVKPIPTSFESSSSSSYYLR